MPNGVICGGAVDGSNQLGAMVTCQPMMTSPGAGACAHARAAVPATSRAVTMNGSAPRANTNGFMTTSTKRLSGASDYPDPASRRRHLFSASLAAPLVFAHRGEGLRRVRLVELVARPALHCLVFRVSAPRLHRLGGFELHERDALSVIGR